MKVYKMTLMFLDHDDVGPAAAKQLIENARLPNHISPGDVMAIEERDIGEWRDDHPLNFRDKQAAAFAALFAEPAAQSSDCRACGAEASVCTTCCKCGAYQ